MADTVEELESAPERYRQMAKRAVDDADTRYGWHHQIEAIRAAVGV